jgi:hypothetical protein
VRDADARTLDAFGTVAEPLDSKLESSARRQLDVLAEGLRQAFAVEPVVDTVRGDAVREIVAAAESATNLVVLGPSRADRGGRREATGLDRTDGARRRTLGQGGAAARR